MIFSPIWTALLLLLLLLHLFIFLLYPLSLLLSSPYVRKLPFPTALQFSYCCLSSTKWKKLYFISLSVSVSFSLSLTLSLLFWDNFLQTCFDTLKNIYLLFFKALSVPQKLKKKFNFNFLFCTSLDYWLCIRKKHFMTDLIRSFIYFLRTVHWHFFKL